MFYVPVIDKDQNPLMPTTPSRARRWIKSGKATPFWKKGVFCVRLNYDPSDDKKQDIAVGIDPGSKKEAFTAKSSAHTCLNIQADAVTWVAESMAIRRGARSARRFRKTPCRKCRWNRANLRNKGRIPPSTKARWQWKLRIANWLSKMFPISVFVVEDVKAKSWKGARRWNASFSPLEVGKNWFYEELGKIAKVELKQGWETKELRTQLGLKKSSNKLSNKFDAHCVDSWVLANWYVGGHKNPDNEKVLFIIPLRFHRRQLHVFQLSKGGRRKFYGGTISLGLKRGGLIKHPRYDFCCVGGSSNNRITAHSLKSGDRLSRDLRFQDCKFISYGSWRAKM